MEKYLASGQETGLSGLIGFRQIVILFSTKPASLRSGQKGNVWFLAGSLFSSPVQPFHRSCSIPRARYIFFPIVNGLASAPEFPEPDDPCSTQAEKVGQVRCDVNFDIVPTGVDPLPSYRQPGVTALEVRVDGKRIPDPFAYRVQSPPRGFTFHVRNGSILTEMGLHDRQAVASIRLRARAMPANQPWISALLRGSSDRFPVLSSA